MGRPGRGGSQLGARLTSTDAIGLNCTGSSSVPAFTMTTPGRAHFDKRAEPQVGQNTRLTGLPLSPVFTYSRTSPVICTAASGTAIEAEWLPDCLRQSRQ